jgi:hypothetical protein
MLVGHRTFVEHWPSINESFTSTNAKSPCKHLFLPQSPAPRRRDGSSMYPDSAHIHSCERTHSHKERERERWRAHPPPPHAVAGVFCYFCCRPLVPLGARVALDHVLALRVGAVLLLPRVALVTEFVHLARADRPELLPAGVANDPEAPKLEGGDAVVVLANVLGPEKETRQGMRAYRDEDTNNRGGQGQHYTQIETVLRAGFSPGITPPLLHTDDGGHSQCRWERRR